VEKLRYVYNTKYFFSFSFFFLSQFVDLILFLFFFFPLLLFLQTWKKRWFVLRESTLSYYKDDKDDKPLGLISLKECKSFELASQKVNKPYAFEIATPDRVYACCAANDDEMWEWINVLRFPPPPPPPLLIFALSNIVNQLRCSPSLLLLVSSTAVQKAGGKETFEFIALKKASELAEKKKALQLQVYRNATVKKYAPSS
jgi:hypothetical protein